MTEWHELTEDPSTWPPINSVVCIFSQSTEDSEQVVRSSIHVEAYSYSLGNLVGFRGGGMAWCTDFLYNVRSYWCYFPELESPVAGIET